MSTPRPASTRSRAPSSAARSTRSRVEMGHKLARMSYSSIIRESEDFGCVICDDEGRQLCESTQSTPLQSGPIPGYIRGHQPPLRRARRGVAPRRRRHPQPRRTTAPRTSPTSAFVVPVFHGGELVGFSATTAHHLDLGALTPGTCGIVDATDAYAEGLQFNAIKIEEEGRRNEWVWRLLRDNMPRAQARRRRHGGAGRGRAGSAPSASSSWSSATGSRRSGRRARTSWTTPSGCCAARSSSCPTARYEAEGRIDGFLDHPDPAYRDLRDQGRRDDRRARTSTSTSTGTSPQVDLPINMPFEGTVDIAIYLTLRSILLDSAAHEPVPTNSGLFRPITITAPEGCLANPRFPAPTIARFCPGNIVADTVMRALAPVVPGQRERGRRQPQGRRVLGPRAAASTGCYMDIQEGSYGGRPARTASTRSTPSTRTRATTRSRTSSRTTRCG